MALVLPWGKALVSLFPREADPVDPSLKAEVSKCSRNSMFSWLLVAAGPCSGRLLWPKLRSKKGHNHQHPALSHSHFVFLPEHATHVFLFPTPLTPQLRLSSSGLS